MPTKREQQQLNDALNQTKELISSINKSVGEMDGGFSDIGGSIKKNASALNAFLKVSAKNNEVTKATVKTGNLIAEAYDDVAENLEDVLKGNKQFKVSSKQIGYLINGSIKGGASKNAEHMREQAENVQKMLKVFENPKFQTAFSGIEKGADRLTGFINKLPGGQTMSKAFGVDKQIAANTKQMQGNMLKFAKSGKVSAKGIGGLLKGTKFLKIGVLGAALAMISFGLEANKTQKALGGTYTQAAKVLATSKAIAAANKLNGMTQEESMDLMMGINREFGNMDKAALGVTMKASNLTANFGLSAGNVGKLARQMQAVGSTSLEASINTIEMGGELARAANVPVADVMNDVAQNTEFFARFAKDGGVNIIAAGIAAKKLGLEMANLASIADSLLDFESSITKQMEAEVLLGKELNLEKAREMVFNNDIAGAMAEVSKLVSPEEFQKMDAVRRSTLAGAVGLDAATFAKAISGDTTGVGDAVIAPGGKVISTSPQDYLIATTNPGTLGGGMDTSKLEGLMAQVAASVDGLRNDTVDGTYQTKIAIERQGIA